VIEDKQPTEESDLATERDVSPVLVLTQIVSLLFSGTAATALPLFAWTRGSITEVYLSGLIFIFACSGVLLGTVGCFRSNRRKLFVVAVIIGMIALIGATIDMMNPPIYKEF
jgi:hypothetical protein